MKVLGGIAILIAAILGWGAYNNYSNASRLRSEIGKQTGFTKFLGEGVGLNSIDRIRIQQAEDTGMKLAVGAGVLGLVGLLMCSGGKE